MVIKLFLFLHYSSCVCLIRSPKWPKSTKIVLLIIAHGSLVMFQTHTLQILNNKLFTLTNFIILQIHNCLIHLTYLNYVYISQSQILTVCLTPVNITRVMLWSPTAMFHTQAYTTNFKIINSIYSYWIPNTFIFADIYLCQIQEILLGFYQRIH